MTGVDVDARDTRATADLPIPVHACLPAATTTYVVTIDREQKYACQSPQLRITVVVTQNAALDATVSLVVVSQQGIPDALDEDLEGRIISTFRTVC